MAAVTGFTYNSGTVIDAGMKFDTDVRRVVPGTILREQKNLSYISAALLENGGRYKVFCL
jgi:hypothetical protein